MLYAKETGTVEEWTIGLEEAGTWTIREPKVTEESNCTFWWKDNKTCWTKLEEMLPVELDLWEEITLWKDVNLLPTILTEEITGIEDYHHGKLIGQEGTE
jgi:hypothetical protein